MSDRHRFFVADVMTGQVRDEISLRTATYTDRLKSPSTLDASISMRDAAATRANLNTETTMLIEVRDGLVVFAGPLISVQKQRDSPTLSLYAYDLWGYVRRRRIRSRQGMTHATGAVPSQIRFSAVDQFHVVEDIIGHIQSISGGDLGITVAYSALSGRTRDRTYLETDRKYAGAAIEELSDVQDGFDWALEVSGSVDDLGSITHTLRLTYPMRGRTTRLVLSWNGGTNMLGLAYVESSRDRAQSYFGVGAGDNDAQLTSLRQDPSLLGVLPLLEADDQWPDVSVQSTLDAHVERRLGLNRRAARTPILDLDPDAEPRWGEYLVGDIVTAELDDGWVQHSGPCRITARSLTVGQDGSATSSVELAELGRF